MTLTLTRPRRTRTRLTRTRLTPSELARLAPHDIHAIEAGRIAVCCGPHFLGWYPADALADVLEDLARWAVDPAARDGLPWPRAFPERWEWRAGEVLAVWRGGQVLALVSKPAAGEAVVTRLDRS